MLWGAWGQVDRKPVLATGGDDRFVRLWEVIEDRRVSRLPSYRSDVERSRSMSFPGWGMRSRSPSW